MAGVVFAGKIALDVRDRSRMARWTWRPKAPEGVPNGSFIVWDEIGYGTMDRFGGPVWTPTMTRIVDMGVRYSNFHYGRIVLTDSLVHPDGRNVTSNGMVTIAE